MEVCQLQIFEAEIRLWVKAARLDEMRDPDRIRKQDQVLSGC